MDNNDSKLITDKDGVLRRWTGYCGACTTVNSLDTDGSILQTNRYSTESEDSPPVLKGEVEPAVKTGK